MKKQPKTIPCEFRDPKLPPFRAELTPLDFSDEPGPTPENALPQQLPPTDEPPRLL